MSPLASRPALLAIATCALAYAASLTVLLRMPGASAIEPLFLLGVLGIAFPALALLLTRRPAPVTRGLTQPPRTLWTVLLYLALFAVLVLGWGFSALKQALPGEPAQSVAELAVKLVVMVALPLLLFVRGSRQPRRFAATRLWWMLLVMGVAFLAFQAVFGRGLGTLRELGPSATTLAWAIPACLAWQTLEAGLAEEVLFRRVLQQRLADALRSPLAGVLWASLLFGLAHAPGLYLRGAHQMEGVAEATVPWAIAYSVVMIAPAGIVFGVLWARTRSLSLVVLLHGLVDLLPQLAPFIRTWA